MLRSRPAGTAGQRDSRYVIPMSRPAGSSPQRDSRKRDGTRSGVLRAPLTLPPAGAGGGGPAS
eukprot:581277-Pyramimonas_sp.AAC.2